VLDEIAHAAVGALVAARRPPEETGEIVAASVLIDLDHLPSELGREWLRPAARGRPYPHTAFTVLLALAAGRRPTALALAAHFGRDLTDADSGVRLLWPLSLHEFFVPPPLYPMAIGALASCGR